jgi:hypothetical protein
MASNPLVDIPFDPTGFELIAQGAEGVGGVELSYS